MAKYKRNWQRMTDDAHSNSRGWCEWCRKRVPYGTPPAHIIPRNPNDPTLDEPWNLASMGFVTCQCHTKFDANRAKAVRQMREEGGTVLLNRINKHPRLKEYFDKKESRQQYLDDMEQRRTDGEE